jgi:hypothetical protein
MEIYRGEVKGPCYPSSDDNDGKIRARKQRTDIAKYSVVNNTIKLLNRLPAEALSHYYVLLFVILITRLKIFNILFPFVFYFVFLFSRLCILCFCIVFVLIVYCFSFCAVSFLFLYKYTDHCHRLETQLQ